MNMWINRTAYILLVTLWIINVLPDAVQSSCGPLETKLAEYDACYDPVYTEEMPCPVASEEGTKFRKICRLSHSLDKFGERIRDVTYHCRQRRWRYSDDCQSDCGRSRPNNKYPWIVAIYNEKEELKCTGTIISTRYILTAVSCFDVANIHDGQVLRRYLKDISNFTIIAGRHYINIRKMKETSQIRKIKRAAIENSVTDILLLEVDNGFQFFEDVQPVCVDWDNYYELKDFSEGNEAIAVDWDYNKDERVACEEPNEINVQFWHSSTCQENSVKGYFNVKEKFCGTYINGNRSSCGKSIGAGLFFKSSPWRYYLRGITNNIITEPEIVHILYSTVSLSLNWLKQQMRAGPDPGLDNNPSYFTTRDIYSPKKKTGCILPQHIKYSRFKLVFGETYRPGAWVSMGTRILLICDDNTDEKSISTRCNMGAWQPSIDKLECKRPGTCPPLPSAASYNVTCRLNGQVVSCAEPENNSTALVICKPFYAFLGTRPIYKCIDGVWDHPLAPCTLECGMKRVAVATLIVGGGEVVENEYPWVVAIYESTKQICSGTIISKSYVLTAAHCFRTPKDVPVNEELYTIIAGKYYRKFSVRESSAQIRKIKSLHIHEDYKGSDLKHRDDIALIELDAEWIPALEVQPACLDWENLYEDYDFIDGKEAVVTGWGSTGESPSDVLRKLVVPYRSKQVCKENLPADFTFQYLATDKICAGYDARNMSVCDGDSGGGLYFKSPDSRFYVRGIVSLTAKTVAAECVVNKFALYTKVSKYLQWMERLTRRKL